MGCPVAASDEAAALARAQVCDAGRTDALDQEWAAWAEVSDDLASPAQAEGRSGRTSKRDPNRTRGGQKRQAWAKKHGVSAPKFVNAKPPEMFEPR